MLTTLVDDRGGAHRLEGPVAGVDAAQLSAATGWVLKPAGLCRGPVCVPLLGRRVVADDGRIDLRAWADVLGLPLAVDDDHGAAALGAAVSDAALVVGGEAPDLELADVDGDLHAFSELAGRKRVLVTWASWCGCRHELPAWQALQDELGPEGVSVWSVALDGSPDDARPWIEAARPTYPVVVDPAHVTAERYGITNVPSTVWVDEDGRIAKGPTIAPGDDQFVDYTHIDAASHHEALRRWVRDGELPEPTTPAGPRSADDGLAHAERRLGAWLLREGRSEAAASHLARAGELAPWDWTVRRASIALSGGDPFLGEEFLDLWTTWDAAGRPGYTTT